MLDDTNEPQDLRIVSDGGAFLELDGDAVGIAGMFDGAVAEVGDICELVCTKAGIPSRFKLRVVKRAEATQN